MDIALGHYEGGLWTIRLDSKLLEYHPTDIPKLNLLTDVLGHEITHALRGEDAFKYREEFSSRVSTLAASQAIPRDYTPLIQEFVEWRRQEEAIAELGGINAVASRLQHIDQRPVAEKALANAVGPTSSCVVRNDLGDVIGFKPGKHFDPKSHTAPVTAGGVGRNPRS